MFHPQEMPPAIMEPPAEPVSLQIRTMFAPRRLKDMTIDSLTQQLLELCDMENDPHELRNLVGEPGLSGVRDRFLEEYFGQLLANLNELQLKVYQDGGIPTKFHEEYPEY